jgi:ribosome maturation factor RimP
LNLIKIEIEIETMALTVPHIEELLIPGAEALGLELVAVELSGGDTSILRIYIDTPNGINVDDCTKASRQFSAILDVADPISSQYTLEVSSPGMDRPLAKPLHFKAVVGQQVKIKMATLVNGRRRFTGELIEATEEFAVVEVDGEQSELPYSDMDRARLIPVYDFD